VPTKPPADHPFAKLQALRVPTPEPKPPGTPVGAAPAVTSSGSGDPSVYVRTPGVEPKGPAWAVVRLERKGRRGKEATIVEKLALKPAELERWCKELKQALGCGGSVEDDAIVLQGDLRPRLEALLTKRGVRKVTIAG
jgi:translation initiation factor 1